MGKQVSQEKSFGIIPIHPVEGERRFLLVQHRKGHWGFPKGKPDPRETPIQTALRELEEETALGQVELIRSPKFVEVYDFSRRRNQKTHKTVTYFLGFVDHENVKLPPNELLDYAWGNAHETRQRLTYTDAKQLFDQVIAHLDSTAH